MSDPTIVVTGFPRSGTSAMMTMLGAAGVPLYYDHPVSYETEKALQLPGEGQWLEECQGCAVKILEPLKFSPPQGLSYKFIWMSRRAPDIATSQARMLKALGNLDLGAKERRDLANSFMADKGPSLRLLESYPSSQLLEIRFSDLIKAPQKTAFRIAEFLDLSSSVVEAMAGVVHKRKPEPLVQSWEVQALKKVDAYCRMEVFSRDPGQEWELHQEISFPFPFVLKGEDRRVSVEMRSGAIVSILQYPHKPDVLGPARKAFTPEYVDRFIPALQASGRSLLRRDWYVMVYGKEADCDRDWQFFSSMEVYRELENHLPNDGTPVTSTEAPDFIKSAGTIA